MGTGVSLVGVTGIEASAGYFINFKGIVPNDFGMYGATALGVGLNISGDIFSGVIWGDACDISGITENVNFSFWFVSLSLFKNAETGKILGFTAGVGPGATFFSGSAMRGITGSISYNKVNKFIYGIFE